MPAAASYAAQALPMGLPQRDRLQRDVAEGAMLTHDDVVLDQQNLAVAARAALIEQFGSAGRRTAHSQAIGTLRKSRTHHLMNHS